MSSPVQYEDRVRLATPEGVELELLLAGLGSRLSARLIDWMLQLLILFGVLLVSLLFGGSDWGAAFTIIFTSITAFFVFWGYDVLFETLNGGRTPGKMRLGLRVVGSRGEPVRLPESAVRNILRVVDGPLTLFLGAGISITRSDRNRRIGDAAAGTLVVRDRPSGAEAPSALVEPSPAELDAALSWDVTGVSDREMAAVRGFIERRSDLDRAARSRLAGQLSERLRAQVPGGGGDTAPERFLELLAAVKARRG